MSKKVVDHSKQFHQRKTEIITIGKTDATSSKLEADFHDLPYAGLLAAARRFAYGRLRHGRFNWKKGDAAFAEERLKHLMNHTALFMEYRKQEDLDALLCNAFMIAWFLDLKILSTNPVKLFMMQGKNETSST